MQFPNRLSVRKKMRKEDFCLASYFNDLHTTVTETGEVI